MPCKGPRGPKGAPMQSRIDFTKVAPNAVRAMQGLESHIRSTRLESPLLHLVRMRASQINGCAFCLDMHSKDARAEGETEQRLYALNAWRETPFFTDRERAALAWTEALTLIHETHAPDEVYREVKAQFSDEDLVSLSLAVVAINGWNRLCIGFRAVPGTYQAGSLRARYFDESLGGGMGIGSRFLLMMGDDVEPSTREAARQLCDSLGDVVELRASHHPGLTLVRPDGYVAGAASGHDGVS